MSDLVRILTLVALVALGWLIGKDLEEGNLPVAGGLIVIAAGTIIGFNRHLKNECAGKMVGSDEMERVAPTARPS